MKGHAYRPDALYEVVLRDEDVTSFTQARGSLAAIMPDGPVAGTLSGQLGAGGPFALVQR